MGGDIPRGGGPPTGQTTASRTEQSGGPVDVPKILPVRLGERCGSRERYGSRESEEPLAQEGATEPSTAVTPVEEGVPEHLTPRRESRVRPPSQSSGVCEEEVEVDLSGWCEHLFVSGLSSAETVRIEKRDPKD
jgi:hypothetical protein